MTIKYTFIFIINIFVGLKFNSFQLTITKVCHLNTGNCLASSRHQAVHKKPGGRTIDQNMSDLSAAYT